MIPKLIRLTQSHPHYVLPPGIHKATLEEIKEEFAVTPYRMHLFRGFCSASESLVAAGCQRIYLDGSFTTSKNHPGNFDACWDPEGVNLGKVDSTILNDLPPRTEQKKNLVENF